MSVKPSLFLLLPSLLVSLTLADDQLPLRIHEVLSRNEIGIQDGFNNREDWIEISNPNSEAINLAGYHLSDDDTNLTKWTFPAVSIPANGFLLVFASGQDVIDPGGFLHTNFSLSSLGEPLVLVQPDGLTIEDSLGNPTPEQFTDISYGRPQSGGDGFLFFDTPTPGAANTTSPFPGVVKDTRFQFNRGFYSAPFTLAITSDTPNAIIRYTVDGSAPTPTSGLIYEDPINISSTTTVRAIATFSNWLPTNVDTHTYLFVDDVVSQPTNPPNWPSNWGFDSEVGQNVTADYEMDPRVVNNTNGLGVHTVQDALRDIPTVALSMPQSSLTGGTGGMLTNPKGRFERECSVEYILPDGTTGFQEDCKIETHGNSSRRPFRMQKHSMRLTFSSSVGVPKLNYPLFPDSEVESFNKLVLRACFTDSWALNTWSSARYRPNDSLYTRDVWMKESMTDMGHASGHGNFVHLYYNGLYFGIHNLTERYEDDWYADHLGGETEDWDVYADFQPGSIPPRWTEMMNVLNGSITSQAVYDQAQDYLDLDNYIDYLILHYYADSEDWPTKNAYAAVNSISGDGRFRFQAWDQEIALDKFSWNRYSNGSGAAAPFQRLRLNEEFRLKFADRVHRNLFNDGPLSETKSISRFLEVASMIDKAIVAESARWGDTQDNTPYGMTAQSSTNIDADYYPPTINNPIYFTREQHWLEEIDVVTNHYIPILHDQNDSRSLVRELQVQNLYPDIAAPVYSQHGGVVPNGFSIGVTSQEGDIFYTTDGSDPRLTGGAVNPTATSVPGPIINDQLIDFESTGWRYLDTGVALSNSNIVRGTPGYDSTDWKHPDFNESTWGTGQSLLGFGTINGIPRRTTINGPAFITYYFRKDFEVTNADEYTELLFELIRDDGAIVYLNGKEVGRSNLVAGVITSTTTASSASPENAIVPLPILTLAPGDLVEGTNTIAVEIHQSSPGNNDVGLDLRLLGARPNIGGSFISLTQTGTLKARTLNDGEWSALTEAPFIVGTAAAAGKLIITEIHYNPAGDDAGQEWLELMNISSDTIDLTGVSLSGINYTFATGTLLGPGERIVIVEDQTTFAALYDTAGIRIAPGVFTGSLTNGGEELALIDSTGTNDIQRFTYDDESPWPVTADGLGFSLVLIAPSTNPTPSSSSNWRASFSQGGTPGGTDAETFTGDPNADDDGDGLTALLEYALGSIDGDTAPSPESIITLGSGFFGNPPVANPTISYRRNPAAEDISILIETSSDLETWITVQTEILSATPNGDGTETILRRLPTDISATTREFIRLKVIQLP